MGFLAQAMEFLLEILMISSVTLFLLTFFLSSLRFCSEILSEEFTPRFGGHVTCLPEPI